MNKAVVITGTNGFIGRALAERFIKNGWKVYALQRKSEESTGQRKIIHYSINQAFDEAAIQDIHLLIHCAWQPFSSKEPDADTINFEGTRKLQQFAHQKGAKFIFISTLSAHADVASHYGLNKLKTENLIDNNKNLTLKLGLVIGNEGGLFQKIAAIIRKSKFIPMVDGGRQPMQTIWMEDLFSVIIKSYETNLCGNYAVAENNPITMRELYQLIANQKKAKPIFFSIPYQLVYVVMRIPEILHLPLGLTTENLKGLKQLKAFDTATIQAKLKLSFSTAKETIEKVCQGQ